jgi:hypothetical protein
MNPRAGARSHTPVSSGSEPDDGADRVTDFLDLIDPERA